MLLVALGLVLVLWMKSPGGAEPITDADGKTIDGSISVVEKIVLGGQEQYLFIRGANTAKPVMPLCMEGRVARTSPFMKNYNRDIEKDFIMVYWHNLERGSPIRKTFPLESMTLAHFISDTKELSKYLAKRFNQEKIYIMGHSWGSLLGILTAYQYPEQFHAYFGIGQVAHQYKAEKISFKWVREQALQQNDKDAIKKLSAMTFPDSLATSTDWIAFIME